MSEQEILILAGLVKEASETLWQIALIKVYGTAVQYGLWSILFFVLCVGMSFGSVRCHQLAKHATGDRELDFRTSGWLFLVGSIICFLAFGGFLTASAGRLVAPEFFALKELIALR